MTRIKIRKIKYMPKKIKKKNKIYAKNICCELALVNTLKTILNERF